MRDNKHILATPDSIRKAAEIVRSGGVVALPTETFYALAVDPFSPKALEKLFTIKKRSLSKPILLLISSHQQLQLLVKEVPPLYESLLRIYWPGPLTLIFRASSTLPSLLTGGTGTVGIRFSSSDTVMKLCSELEGPVTGTSANISGGLPGANSKDILKIFGNQVDLVLENRFKNSLQKKGSTIVDGLSGKLRVIREGVIPEHEIL